MKKLIPFLITFLIITGCANLQKPAPTSNPKLPTVKKFKAYPDRNSIALFWEPIYSMSGYYIQKYYPSKKKWLQIATINDPYKSIYIDNNLKPNTIYKYRIATFNKDKIPSLAKEISQKTLPPIEPVIPLEAKPLAKGKVKIIFRPHSNERVVKYIIQKLNDKKVKWENIATLSPRLNVEFIDNNLKDGKIYRYRIIAVTFDNIQSVPSKQIVVSTYAKPPIVFNIKASINLPRQIKITFAPLKGVSFYKIYRSNYPNGPFKFIAKTKKNVYIDKIDEDGAKRWYKVTAVSMYNTESLLDESPTVMGETLTKPSTPIVSTNISPNFVEFIFTSPDNRAVKYLVIKKEKINLLNYKEKKIIVNSNSFKDKISPNKSYIYNIYAVDKYGLISKKPAKVEVGD